MDTTPHTHWWHYHGDGVPTDDERRTTFPAPPPWRTFHGTPCQSPPPDDEEDADRKLGRADVRPLRRADRRECDMVNAAILLRRPLLVTGNPGTGKSSIAFRIARELRLGRVLQWPITSRTTLRSAQYEYDAIGRAQAGADRSDTDDPVNIGDFIRLGPLGTALLPYERPRVLLIDELDKSDADLPNDLLHIFENGEFTIPELLRVRRREPEVAVFTDDPDQEARVRDGRVRCRAFPIVVITSNGEREFPPAFLRRCLRMELAPPTADDLAAMVRAQLPALVDGQRELIEDFLNRPEPDGLARDQLLNAMYLTASDAYGEDRESWQDLITSIWHPLSGER
ncbi:ATPase AAA [Virgisporangium aliadipatigenens]|uniref:ATPase AAA n=1 Tax=Virgisporangium aliadipatigenens TaxID=741659 RepID=A0A8J3YRE9_9ACTN|nr:MoxR family ATPase [Virgisporangium aliadipatigenens]GIJ48486.1 ATPase AAA [Virgisporangium aliadipatigenens]